MLYRCDSCSKVSASPHSVCPRCKSQDFTEVEMLEASVISSVELAATAEPFPEHYFVNIVEVDECRLFCRSGEKLHRGAVVRIEKAEGGTTCS